MARFLKAIIILFVTLWICSFTSMAIAEPAVKTNVRIIHASQGRNHIDSDLSDLAEELEELSSFSKYKSYRLIKAKNMRLNENQKGSVNLPGKQSLIIIPIRISEKKIEYQISFLKSGDQAFSAQIHLKNGRSMTIGRPKFKKGYLLFNISGNIL